MKILILNIKRSKNFNDISSYMNVIWELREMFPEFIEYVRAWFPERSICVGVWTSLCSCQRMRYRTHSTVRPHWCDSSKQWANRFTLKMITSVNHVRIHDRTNTTNRKCGFCTAKCIYIYAIYIPIYLPTLRTYICIYRLP